MSDPTNLPQDSGNYLIDPLKAMCDWPNRGGMAMPVGWEVTSDSIAAECAQRLQLDELVLLKSRGCKSSEVTQWVHEGLVDSYFPVAAECLRTRVVNLRKRIYATN